MAHRAARYHHTRTRVAHICRVRARLTTRCARVPLLLVHTAYGTESRRLNKIINNLGESSSPACLWVPSSSRLHHFYVWDARVDAARDRDGKYTCIHACAVPCGANKCVNLINYIIIGRFMERARVMRIRSYLVQHSSNDFKGFPRSPHAVRRHNAGNANTHWACVSACVLCSVSLKKDTRSRWGHQRKQFNCIPHVRASRRMLTGGVLLRICACALCVNVYTYTYP